jgi:uncharacterized small protein (DUF1192 family)
VSSPWEHPPLHDCSACARKRETALQAEVERLHAELASARTVERKDLHEQIAALRAQNEGVGEQLVKAIDEIASLRALHARIATLEAEQDLYHQATCFQKRWAHLE